MGTLVVLFLAAMPTTGFADTVTETVARVKRAVVAVGTFSRTRTPQFVFHGTGFVVDDGTLIVTNAHVLAAPLDGKTMGQTGILVPQEPGSAALFRPAQQVATDAERDLAILKISGMPLPALLVGDSGSVQEGQSVLITGFPIGAMLGPFASTHRGMIAAIAPIAIPQGTSADLDPKLVRRLVNGTFDIFQLDAIAYPGSSGSPVYEPDTGVVLGVVNIALVKGTREAAVSQPSGVTYAIPASFIRDLLRKAR